MVQEGSFAEYLTPGEIIRWDGDRLPSLGAEIVGTADDAADKAQALFYWVRDRIKYNPYAPFFLPEHYWPESTLDRGYGYCVQKAVLLTALARTQSVPARMVFADIVNHRFSEKLLDYMGTDVFTYHAYVDLFVEDRWVQVTPSFDRELCDKLEIFPVEFDGRNTAILHKLDRHGRPHIEYVRQHGVRADVPLAEILEGWEKAYSKERVEAWKQAFLNGVKFEALA